jgi:hypothetical protein
MELQTTAFFQELSRNNWLAITISAGSFMLSALGGFIGAYTKRKGEGLAEQENFKTLLAQTARTAEMTEQIKTGFLEGSRVGESELEYRQTQLADFYGPIYARLKVAEELYGMFMRQELKEINLEIIQLFRSNNEAITQTITTRAHLIDGSEIPACFTKYITSVTIWNFYTSRPGQPWIDEHVAHLPQVAFPVEFRSYIIEKTEELKKRLDSLYIKYVFR